jgi:NADPH-dependent glutamate synthase beta subunit-like oxidoreductase/NAD(P)H-flavin reductase
MPTGSPNRSTSLPAKEELRLGMADFSYADLHNPVKLAELTRRFREFLRAADAPLAARYDQYAERMGEGYEPAEVSEILVAVGSHLGRFIEQLFGLSVQAQSAREWAVAQAPIFRFRTEFLTRRILRNYPTAESAGAPGAEDQRLVRELSSRFAERFGPDDDELRTARLGVFLLDANKPAGAKQQTELQELMSGLIPAGWSSPDLHTAVLKTFEQWCAYAYYRTRHLPAYDVWSLWRTPEDLDYEHGLVECHVPDDALAGELAGPDWRKRDREGFVLTDQRMDSRQALTEVDYCIFCHERDKDSCSKGLFEKDGTVKKNPLGISLDGCPLDEKISEAHLLKSCGDGIAALAMVMLDNPMCPGTGHRICNDCMKSCIYQKQEPVNIPQIETRILTDVLELPWGVEIYDLLARWNPLNVRRPHLLPYNGLDVLVVGLGPAGYTLAHYLVNEGFGVVGIDGLKIEPMPIEWTGDDRTPPTPIRDVNEIRHRLDQRVLEGFGGVSEYGITVRWDKNFLTLLHLCLSRRAHMRIYAGVRFGGTLTIEDAFDRLGFVHIAIAAGAGKPTVLEIKNNLIKGIRMASDFLMALQLTGAFKEDALANLQVRLPALVIGGGLTAIDSATELLAYYPVQVEKLLRRFETLAKLEGEEAFWWRVSVEDRIILTEFLDHARHIRTEREDAKREGRKPDIAGLLQKWGGVRIAYRKDMVDAPAYRLNHEEVIKSFEEGVLFTERLSPTEAIRARDGSLDGVIFEKQTKVDGKWKASGEFVTLPARAMLVAAGTSPNTIYEREYPGTFELDQWGQFFQPYRRVATEDGSLALVKTAKGETGFFTSYSHDGKCVSFYGDNHPRFSGNVVKAMASAKHGYVEVASLFERALSHIDPARQPERESKWRDLTQTLDDELIARVHHVERLTQTIVEVVVRAPAAARRFHPGQFYRLQNFERHAPRLNGTTLAMEGLALTGAWVDRDKGLLSLIVLEMGASSRLCAYLKPGEPVIVMGPTGSPTEMPANETVLLAGGGLGNAVLFSIADGLKSRGNRVIYFAGYKRAADLFKREEVESGTDVVVWSTDADPPIPAQRPQDRSFVGNIVQAINAYGRGQFGEPQIPLSQVDRIIAIGSDRMMNAVREARHGVLADLLPHEHVAIGSINSTMQCMMKEICAQCLQMHVDPITGEQTGPVFSCFNQDQPLDQVDFLNLNERLKTNSALEHVANKWFDHLISKASLPHV